jgi:hypothetical protein
VIGWWFTPVSSTNKINRHDIIEVLLKVVLNTISLNQQEDTQNKVSTFLDI